MIPMTCPKCGATMVGPKWDSNSDRLKYVCVCGYADSRRPLDRRESAKKEGA